MQLPGLSTSAPAASARAGGLYVTFSLRHFRLARSWSLSLGAGAPRRARRIKRNKGDCRPVALARALSTKSLLPISAQDPLIRVSPGMWGLNDRDVPVKRYQQGQLIDELVNVLTERNEGIHISEIQGLCLHNTSISPYLVLSIATLDPRIRSNVGQYFYLAVWDDVRRLSPLEAVKGCLHDAVAPLGIEQIRAVTEGLIKRPCATATVSQCLRAIDAEFDKGSNTWSVPRSLDDPTPLDEIVSA